MRLRWRRRKANLANAEATAQSLNITVPVTSVNTSSQLELAASGIEDANAGVIAAERQLSVAHAQLQQAEANDVKAQDDLRRYKLLVDKREIAEQIYDQALASAKSGTATVAAARATESATEQFIQPARSRLVQAAANYNTRRADRSKYRRRGLAFELRSRMLSTSAPCSGRPN
jgi:membrane fusion protein, multidrug efflux system